MIEYIAVILFVIILSILAFMLGTISVALPIWITIIPIIMFIGVALMFYLYWSDISKYNPEGHLFVEARKKDVPLIKINHLNGFFKFVVGKKEKKGDLMFQYDKEHREGVRIDPAVQSGHVPSSRTIRNLTVYEMGTNSPWALSTKNVLAFRTILDHVRKNYPQLNFFSDLVLLEFVKKERSSLRPDCENLVKLQDIQLELPQEDIDRFRATIRDDIETRLQEAGKVANDGELADLIDEQFNQRRGELYVHYGAIYLTKLFMQIQDEVTSLKLETHSVHNGKVIEGVFFSFAEAFQNISSAWSAADIQTLSQWFEIIGSKKNNALDNLKWMAAFAMIAMMVLVGAGLGAYIAGLGK